MAQLSGVLTGTAGVYYAASQLAARGFHAAVTYGNAPSVDILVGLRDGTSALSLQVKTARYAFRTRGRGPNKQPHHYEWDVGERSARLDHCDLFFAFVNLRWGRLLNVETQLQALPEVFIVPSRVVHDYFARWFDIGLKRWRWHPGVEQVEQYKNNWTLLHDHLAGKISQ